MNGYKNDLQNLVNKVIIIAMAEANEKDIFSQQRQQMVRLHLKGRDIRDSAVLKVMGQISREDFIGPQYKSNAYADSPVSIGLGQTISQPYIVALMTQELKVDSGCEVLEIGTGSGYQTAILAGLVKKVYTIERYEDLLQNAKAILSKLGIENVEFFLGDGSCGWPGRKKFDRIIVTAATAKMPQALTSQLADGGIAIAPVGGEYVQDLVVFEKRGRELLQRKICSCRFVRLVGKYGYGE